MNGISVIKYFEWIYRLVEQVSQIGCLEIKIYVTIIEIIKQEINNSLKDEPHMIP